MLKRIVAGLALVLSLAAVAVAADRRSVDAAEAEKKTAELIGKIAWQRSIDDALALATKQDKLVFWMHVKGDLDGST